MSNKNQTFAGNTIASNYSVSGINNQGWGTSLGMNQGRHAWYIQNLGTSAILVNLSSNTPTTGTFSFLLQGGTSQFDGNGQSWSDQFGIYKGAVSVTGISATPPIYICWDL